MKSLQESSKNDMNLQNTMMHFYNNLYKTQEKISKTLNSIEKPFDFRLHVFGDYLRRLHFV